MDFSMVYSFWYNKSEGSGFAGRQYDCLSWNPGGLICWLCNRAKLLNFSASISSSVKWDNGIYLSELQWWLCRIRHKRHIVKNTAGSQYICYYFICDLFLPLTRIILCESVMSSNYRMIFCAIDFLGHNNCISCSFRIFNDYFTEVYRFLGELSFNILSSKASILLIYHF